MRGINSIILPPSKTAANRATGLPQRPRRQEQRARRRLILALAGSCISSYYQNDGGFVLTSYWIFNLDRRVGRAVWRSENSRGANSNAVHMIEIWLTSCQNQGETIAPPAPQFLRYYQCWIVGQPCLGQRRKVDRSEDCFRNRGPRSRTTAAMGYHAFLYLWSLFFPSNEILL